MKLGDWLIQQELSVPAFARRIGVRKMTVYRWLAGKRVPRPEHMHAIALQTRGEVTANDFHEQPSVRLSDSQPQGAAA